MGVVLFFTLMSKSLHLCQAQELFISLLEEDNLLLSENKLEH